MYDNIGEKIQKLAGVFCALGIIGSIVTGIVLIVQHSVGLGILCMILGSLLSWVSTFVLYGFGHLIENTDVLVARTKTPSSKPMQSTYTKAASAPITVQEPTSAETPAKATKETPTETPQNTTFEEKIKKIPTLTLEDIIQNPKDHLLGEKELQLIREELQARKNAQQ